MNKEAEALTQCFDMQDLWEFETLARHLDFPNVEEFETYSEEAIETCLTENSSILAEIVQKFGDKLAKFSKLLNKKEKLCQTK